MCLIAVKNGKVNIRYCPSAVNSGSRHLSPANRSFADHNAIILLQNSLRSAQCAINCGELRGLDARAPDQGVGGKCMVTAQSQVRLNQILAFVEQRSCAASLVVALSARYGVSYSYVRSKLLEWPNNEGEPIQPFSPVELKMTMGF